MKKVLPDTNAWMAMAEFHLDLFQEVKAVCDFPTKIYVLSGIIEELQQIQQQQQGRFRTSATLALQLLRDVPKLSSQGKVDDELVRLSHQGDLIITQDRALKKKLRPPYLTIRQKKKLLVVDFME